MSQVEIINRALQKPWMLISCYEVSFNNYLYLESRKQRLQNLLPHAENERAKSEVEEKIFVLEGCQKNTAENLRRLDEQIHNYIKTHQE